MTNIWEKLSNAIKALAEIKGAPVLFWWRDDDAGRDAQDPNLHRLVGLAQTIATPLALAVIPAKAQADLNWLGETPNLSLLQHGWMHTNHAVTPAKKIELGGRSVAAILDDIRQGRAAMKAIFGPASLPVLVPPWNRINAAVIPHLPRLGLQVLSTHGPRGSAWAAPGLIQANTHCDPIRWGTGQPRAPFLGEEAAIAPLLRSLTQGEVGEETEPYGLLTHHQVQDEAVWAFITRFISFIHEEPSAHWVSLAEALGAGKRP